MKNTKTIGAFIFDLQLFADGAGGAEGGAPTAGNAPVAGEQQGVNGATPAPQEQAPDLDAEFDELIKGKFKEQYGKRVKGAVDNRFKNTDAELTKLRNLASTAASAYGLSSADDVDALSAKMREQAEASLEDRAYKAGRSKEDQQLIERQNYELERMREAQIREQNIRKQQEWERQGAELQKTLPAFDFQQEVMTNERFGALLSAGADVAEAYRATHPELTTNAMAYAAQQAAQSVAASVRANGMRPPEAGLSSAAPSQINQNPATFTREDFERINRRVAAGERITFKN